MPPLLMMFLLWIGAAIAWWLIRQPVPKSTGARALDEATERLGRRLRALQEPRPERAAIAVDDGAALLDGTFAVPPRATVFPTANPRLGGKMAASHVRPSRAGDLTIAQLSAWMQSEAVVFDRDRNVAWAPEGAIDLVFRDQDRELIEVGGEYEHNPAAHRIGKMEIVSPLQSEMTWYVARHRWSTKELVFQAEIELPQGWPHELVLSPDERCVCVVFIDQTEAGWILVDIDDEENAVTHNPHFQRRSNLIGTPVWSSDGRRIAGVTTDSWDWWLPPEPPSGKDPAARGAALDAWRSAGAAGGRVSAGWLFVQERESDEVTEHELFVELPTGWGADFDDELPPMFGALRFIDGKTIEIFMPDASKQLITLA